MCRLHTGPTSAAQNSARKPAQVHFEASRNSSIIGTEKINTRIESGEILRQSTLQRGKVRQLLRALGWAAHTADKPGSAAAGSN